MRIADFLVLGGGIAGVSAAAKLAPHGRVILLEAESAFGYHSSGRSATFCHYGIGNSIVRGLTAFSLTHFDRSNEMGVPLSSASPALFVATPDMVEALDALERDMTRYSPSVGRLDKRALGEMVPVLRTGGDDLVAGLVDRGARRLDSEALQQDYRAQVRKHGGILVNEAQVVRLERIGESWVASTAAGERFAAPIVINAAGSWCDEMARLAGVKPLGLQPLRRTIIAFDSPLDYETAAWPFVKTALDDFYMLPQSGRLLASPVDEVPSEPSDAQPEDYDVALAAAKVEQYTTITVRRISHSWAGLRTFAPDRVPVAGFAPDTDGFFWLAGQGGFGLQTAPAMSAVAESLVVGTAWPEPLSDWGISPESLRPERFQSA